MTPSRPLCELHTRLLRLHLSVFYVDLVAAQHDGHVLAHAAQVAVPRRNILVREPRRDVKHDDGALPVDVVAVTQATKLLLAGRVPTKARSLVGKHMAWQTHTTHAGGIKAHTTTGDDGMTGGTALLLPKGALTSPLTHTNPLQCQAGAGASPRRVIRRTQVDIMALI